MLSKQALELTASTNKPAQETPNVCSVGEQLRQAREQAGVSIETLSVQLKVSVRNIASVEANAWDELPDFVYARALIASIGRHLKLDTHALLLGVPLPPSTGRLLPQPAVDLSRSRLDFLKAPGAARRYKTAILTLLIGACLTALALWAQRNPWTLAHGFEQIQRWSTALGLADGPAPADLAVPTKDLAPPASGLLSTELPQDQTAPPPVPAGHVVQDISPGVR